MKRKYIAAILTVFAMTTVCSTAFGATEHYTDSSVTASYLNCNGYIMLYIFQKRTLYIKNIFTEKNSKME